MTPTQGVSNEGSKTENGLLQSKGFGVDSVVQPADLLTVRNAVKHLGLKLEKPLVVSRLLRRAFLVNVGLSRKSHKVGPKEEECP